MKKAAFLIAFTFMAQSFASTRIVMNPGSAPSYGVFIDGHIWNWLHTSEEAINELKKLRESGVCR